MTQTANLGDIAHRLATHPSLISVCSDGNSNPVIVASDLAKSIFDLLSQGELERVADAIDAARYAHPSHPRNRPRPFRDADTSDREYAIRLARAAIWAMQNPQTSEKR